MQSLKYPNDKSASKRISVLKASINVVTWKSALQQIQAWVEEGSSRYVCICNAHSVVTAAQDPKFLEILEGADMATPDGAPVAWLMRRFGAPGQERINGPDLMNRYCAEASVRGESVYLYGGSEVTLDVLQKELPRRFPGIKIAGAYSPPYRELTQKEQEAAIDSINASGAGTVWVSLGCPKQEAWMAAHRGRVNAVMVGVGAAFDYHAGTIRRAPLWMQHNGLEWLFRLLTEPRRLWKRYLVTNSLFIWLAVKQLIKTRVGRNR